MNNVIELHIRLGTLSGYANRSRGPIDDALGAGVQYLGSEYLADHADLTGAIRAFNLPAAVAPGEWPEREAWSDFSADLDYHAAKADRARWGHD